MGGYITQIQHCSVNDGEGIRTLIFLAGCPLRCAWCANPEGQTRENPMTRWMETEEVLQAVRRQAIFYRFSGGGVTFSGGEATAQGEFFQELTQRLFMDLKHPDPMAHRRFTGLDNRLVLENLRRTAQLGPPLVVRIPVILGVNGTDETMAACFRLLGQLAPRAALELLPYHRLGEEKYRQLGRPVPSPAFGIPSQDQLDHWRAMAQAMGRLVVSYR